MLPVKIPGPILHKLKQGLESTINNHQQRILLKSIFLLAFNAFLRQGELVVKSKGLASMVIQGEDISVEFNQTNSLDAVLIVMKYFKTNKTKDIFHIHMKVLKEKSMCPVKTLHEYFQIFRHQNGPFYQFIEEKPVTYIFV